MNIVFISFFVFLGVVLGITFVMFIPNLLKQFSRKKKSEFDIVFRIDWYCQPSLFQTGHKGQLIKSPTIHIKILAKDQDEALHMLDEIIRNEMKGELVSIKQSVIL